MQHPGGIARGTEDPQATEEVNPPRRGRPRKQVTIAEGERDVANDGGARTAKAPEEVQQAISQLVLAIDLVLRYIVDQLASPNRGQN